MKISKFKIGILFIFVTFILIESISFATYQNSTLGIANENSKSAIKKEIELDTVYLSDEENEVLNLINEYRITNGLDELKPFSDLQDIAKLKAEDIVKNNYFSHTSKSLGTPFEMLQDYNIEYSIAGENLAGNISPEKAVEAWINSPSHRDNILEERFSYTGICAIDSPVYGKIYVQLFMGI